MRKIKIFTLLMLVMMLGACIQKPSFSKAESLRYPIKSDNKIVAIGNFKYSIKENEEAGTCKITWIQIIDTSKKVILEIPESLDGLKVTQIGFEGEVIVGAEDITTKSANIFGMASDISDYYSVWGTQIQQNEVGCIKEIILPDTIQKIERYSFCELKNLEKVNLPKQLESIWSCFEKCPKLTSLHAYEEVEEGLETLILENKWEKFTISKNNSKYKVKSDFLLSKDGKIVYGITKTKKKVRIPKGVKAISAKAFAGNNIKQISIPASVNKIEPYALSCKNATKFNVSKKNKTFAKARNCIYLKKDKSLVAVTMKTKVLKLPKQINKLKNEKISIAGRAIGKIVINHKLNVINVDCFGFGYYEKMTEAGILLYKRSFPKLIGESAYKVIELHVPKKQYKQYKKWLKTYKGKYDIDFYEDASTDYDIRLWRGNCIK